MKQDFLNWNMNAFSQKPITKASVFERSYELIERDTIYDLNEDECEEIVSIFLKGECDDGIDLACSGCLRDRFVTEITTINATISNASGEVELMVYDFNTEEFTNYENIGTEFEKTFKSDGPFVVLVRDELGCQDFCVIQPTTLQTNPIIELYESCGNCITREELLNSFGCSDIIEEDCIHFYSEEYNIDTEDFREVCVEEPGTIIVTVTNGAEVIGGGEVTIIYTKSDVDNDGTTNDEDLDIDGDGILNIDDPDIDGDGILNIDDTDDDGDCIPDPIDEEPQGDCDPYVIVADIIINQPSCEKETGSLTIELVNNDFSGLKVCINGICTESGVNTYEGLELGDYEIFIEDEEGCSVKYSANISYDRDGDGITNNQDTDINDNGTENQNDPDSDGDGQPNSQDLDDDNDGILDEDDDTPQGVCSDCDGDGILDHMDPDLDDDGIGNCMDDNSDNDNILNDDDDDDDNDGIPDLEDDTPQGPCIEICGNGMDDDGNGLIDCVDMECVTKSSCCPSDPEVLKEFLISNGFNIINEVLEDLTAFNSSKASYKSMPTIDDFTELSNGVIALFEDELTELSLKDINAEGILTHNTDFCDGDFDLASSIFNEHCDKYKIWWHYWENPETGEIELFEKVCNYEEYLEDVYPFVPNIFHSTNSNNSRCGETNRIYGGNYEFPGTLEHLFIELDYIQNINSGAVAEYSIPESSSLGNTGYVDIADLTRKELYEIKPSTRLIEARVELERYVAKANEHCSLQWDKGHHYPYTELHPNFLNHPVPGLQIAAWLQESGVILYRTSTIDPNPEPYTVVLPDRILRRINDFIDIKKPRLSPQPVPNTLPDLDHDLRDFLNKNPKLVEYIVEYRRELAHVTLAAAVGIIAATIYEDFVTGGTGVSNDMASFYMAYRLVQLALKI